MSKFKVEIEPIVANGPVSGSQRRVSEATLVVVGNQVIKNRHGADTVVIVTATNE